MAEDKKVKETEVKAKEVKTSEEKKETKAKKSKSKQVKVRVLCSNAAGKYNLPYGKFRICTLPEEQAKEMIDNGDATTDLKAHQKK